MISLQFTFPYPSDTKGVFIRKLLWLKIHKISSVSTFIFKFWLQQLLDSVNNQSTGSAERKHFDAVMFPMKELIKCHSEEGSLVW